MAIGANGLKLVVGDRVGLTGLFLKNTGQCTGPEGFKVWTVQTCACTLCTGGRFVAVDEMSGLTGGNRHINAGNLFKQGTRIQDNTP